MPNAEGEWRYVTRSSAAELSDKTGAFLCGPPKPRAHGPVRVRNTFHFGYEDGTPYFPFGTTSYAWTHQPLALQDQTLATLEGARFNKIRMCVFPKAGQTTWRT